MAYHEIPLTTAPYSDQSFTLTLEGGKRNIHMLLSLTYHDLAECWTARLTDKATGEVLIDLMPLVEGVDLLWPYSYMGIGRAFIVRNGQTERAQPDNETLGSVFSLIWGDDDP